MGSVSEPPSADVPRLVEAAEQWQKGFNQPLPLGASSRLSIVTCMDSRLLPEAIFGLGVGDAEVIRNAGGRVTLDVIRSLTVAQEIVPPGSRTIFVIHHTDCGGQAAVRRHSEFLSVLIHNLGFVLGLLLRVLSLFGLEKLLLRPIKPTVEGLIQSIVKDVNVLKHTPLIPNDVGLYGFLYDCEDGSLTEVCRRPPGSLGKARHVKN